MKSLPFDFSVNRETKTIHVKRGFDAQLSTVWKAWTTAELLDLWWAPKPWRAETKSMDFSEGGFWLYAMVGPEGEKHWSRADYLTIKKEETFTYMDAFADEQGNVNTAFPQNNWTNEFAEKDGITQVDVTLRFEKLEDLEKLIEMGFKEGFTMGMQNLDELLKTLPQTA